MTPKHECIYVRCKMVNLCKGSHCVGAGLDRDGYKVDGFGNIVEKSSADYDDVVSRPHRIET
jgi:hypothetical protein